MANQRFLAVFEGIFCHRSIHYHQIIS